MHAKYPELGINKKMLSIGKSQIHTPGHLPILGIHDTLLFSDCATSTNRPWT